MKKPLVFCNLLCIALFMSGHLYAEERSIPPDLKPELIGRVYLDSSQRVITPQVRKKIDGLVVKLKENHESDIIRIEGGYHRSASRRGNISRSLQIARDVEKYLRLHHHLHLNLCIATDDGTTTSAPARASITLYAYHGEFLEQKLSTK